MAAQTGFGPLGVLEFHHPHPLDGLLPDAEQAGGQLGDDVMVIGVKRFRVAAFPGAHHGVEADGGLDPGDDGVDGDRAEGHAAAVPGDRQLDLGPAVSPAVDFHLQGDVVVAQLEVGPGLGEQEAQLVEAAAGVAQAVVQVDVGQLARLGLPPVAEEQVRGPAAVAQGAENRVDADLEGLGRALLDAVKIIVLAGRTQAAVTLGTPQVIAGLGVDPVGADLDTAAALDALFFVAPDPVLAQGILEPGRGGNGLPGLRD